MLRRVAPWLVLLTMGSAGLAQTCVPCHAKLTPGIVNDWQLSQHAQHQIDCATCHGAEHQSEADVAKAQIPTPETCARCHPERVAQYAKGKHANAWAAMKAMPTFHWQPMALTEGMKGCGGCHKLGLKTADEIRELKQGGAGFGVASCDACHTRHTFSAVEARQPQACQTCHMGFDHAQWEMWSGSKHGVRALLRQSKVLPETTSAPTCQTCHMPGGDHAVHTAWGFLGVREPLPADPAWAAARGSVLQGLGVLDETGRPTPRLEVVRAADVVRLTDEAFQTERSRMVTTCNQCHSANFARGELAKGDAMIRSADLVMADAIATVGGLYKDGVLTRPKHYLFNMPDLLSFHDAPSVIEQKLFVMFSEHRMRAFQGTFHNNPDYALWYGWSELQRDLTEIRALAVTARKDAGK